MPKAMRVTGSLARVMAAIDEIAADPKFQEFQAEMEAAPSATTPTEAELRAMLKANPWMVPD